MTVVLLLDQMSHSLISLKGFYKGGIMGRVKGDTRALDYASPEVSNLGFRV